LMLGKKITGVKWYSLIQLCVGVIIVVGFGVVKAPKAKKFEDGHLAKGILMVVMLCAISGFNGVYFERVLKRSKIKPSYWMLSLQLAIIGIPFTILAIYFRHYAFVDQATRENFNLFQGFDSNWTRGAVVAQGMNGLISGLCMAYADNILKGFAHAMGIILCCILEFIGQQFIPELALQINVNFVLGGILILVATYLYSLKNFKGFNYRNKQGEENMLEQGLLVENNKINTKE